MRNNEASETHFVVTIVSNRFDKVSVLERHRMVNEALADEMDSSKMMSTHKLHGLNTFILRRACFDFYRVDGLFQLYCISVDDNVLNFDSAKILHQEWPAVLERVGQEDPSMAGLRT